MDTSVMHTKAKSTRNILHLSSFPVGVKFIDNRENLLSGPTLLRGHRYCQALMKARHGEHVILDANGITCPAAAAAFGFKSLPEGLKTGKGLGGFGICHKVSFGETMFKGMTVLPKGKIKALYLFPLETADIEPDIVVVEDETEKLMWIALANININGGKRVESRTSLLKISTLFLRALNF